MSVVVKHVIKILIKFNHTTEEDLELWANVCSSGNQPIWRTSIAWKSITKSTTPH